RDGRRDVDARAGVLEGEEAIERGMRHVGAIAAEARVVGEGSHRRDERLAARAGGEPVEPTIWHADSAFDERDVAIGVALERLVQRADARSVDHHDLVLAIAARRAHALERTAGGGGTARAEDG